MICYIQLEISVHNLNEKTCEDFVEKIRPILTNELNNIRSDNDLEIEVIEHAGSEE